MNTTTANTFVINSNQTLSFTNRKAARKSLREQGTSIKETYTIIIKDLTFISTDLELLQKRVRRILRKHGNSIKGFEVQQLTNRITRFN